MTTFFMLLLAVTLVTGTLPTYRKNLSLYCDLLFISQKFIPLFVFLALIWPNHNFAENFTLRDVTMGSDGNFYLLLGSSQKKNHLDIRAFMNNGSPITTFGHGGVLGVDLPGEMAVSRIIMDPSGMFWVEGEYESSPEGATAERLGFLKITREGNITHSFSVHSGFRETFNGVDDFAIDPKRNLHISGTFEELFEPPYEVRRYLPNGEPDSSFNGNGRTILVPQTEGNAEKYFMGGPLTFLSNGNIRVAVFSSLDEQNEITEFEINPSNGRARQVRRHPVTWKLGSARIALPAVANDAKTWTVVSSFPAEAGADIISSRLVCFDDGDCQPRKGYKTNLHLTAATRVMWTPRNTLLITATDEPTASEVFVELTPEGEVKNNIAYAFKSGSNYQCKY